MADVVVTIKIMPGSLDIDLNNLEIEVKEKIKKFISNSDMKTEIEPVAFGLKSLNITFVMDESLGSPDPLTESIAKSENVASAEVTDVRRALG